MCDSPRNNLQYKPIASATGNLKKVKQ